jgi:hypothetical protein
MTGRQPDPTPGIGQGPFKQKLVEIKQFSTDHWLSIVLIFVAFILGLIVRGFFRS